MIVLLHDALPISLYKVRAIIVGLLGGCWVLPYPGRFGFLAAYLVAPLSLREG